MALRKVLPQISNREVKHQIQKRQIVKNLNRDSSDVIKFYLDSTQ